MIFHTTWHNKGKILMKLWTHKKHPYLTFTDELCEAYCILEKTDHVISVPLMRNGYNMVSFFQNTCNKNEWNCPLRCLPFRVTWVDNWVPTNSLTYQAQFPYTKHACDMKIAPQPTVQRFNRLAWISKHPTVNHQDNAAVCVHEDEMPWGYFPYCRWSVWRSQLDSFTMWWTHDSGIFNTWLGQKFSKTKLSQTILVLILWKWKYTRI